MPGVYRSCTCLICLYYISKHQSVFICEVVLFVHILYCFLYSFNLWFSYERFLCCWWPCCCFCFCLLQKALDTYHKLLFKVFFFNCYLAAPRPTFGPLSRGQPHSPDVNHFVLYFRPEGHQEPPSKVGSLSPAKHLVGFEPGTFWFLLRRLNP